MNASYSQLAAVLGREITRHRGTAGASVEPLASTYAMAAEAVQSAAVRLAELFADTDPSFDVARYLVDVRRAQ